MTSHQTASDLGDRLIAEHHHLDALLERLLTAFHCGDSAACQDSWNEFEPTLSAHLELEEALLFPKFEVTNAAETEVLRRQHARLRYLLAEMGVRLELHAVKEETVRNFVEFLRAHAAREDLLYRWANDLPQEAARPLADQVPIH